MARLFPSLSHAVGQSFLVYRAKIASDSCVVGQGQTLRVLGKIFLFERIFPKNLDRP
jgi:hypothetical protein